MGVQRKITFIDHISERSHKSGMVPGFGNESNFEGAHELLSDSLLFTSLDEKLTVVLADLSNDFVADSYSPHHCQADNSKKGSSSDKGLVGSDEGDSMMSSFL